VTFGGDGVMQTARRATASIADPGDDRVPASDLGDNMRIGRRAEIRLDPRDDIGHRKLGAQDAFEMGEEAFCPFLAVRDEPDGLFRPACQGAAPSRSWDRALARSFRCLLHLSSTKRPSIPAVLVVQITRTDRRCFRPYPSRAGLNPSLRQGGFEKAAKGLIPSLICPKNPGAASVRNRCRRRSAR